MSVVLRRLVFALALASLGLFPAARPPAVGASSPGAIRFTEPTIAGIQGIGFESDLRLAPNNVIYSSAPGSLSSTTSFLWRSLDDGRTFKLVPAAQQPSGKLPSCIGGGDTELATDTAGHLYFNDLTLANFSTAFSGNQGTTFAPMNCSSVPDTVVDRQWYAVDGDPTNGGSIFLAYDRVGQGAPSVAPDCTQANASNNVLVIARSPLPAAGPSAGTTFAPSQALSCDEGIMGNDEFFNYQDHGKRVFVIHDNAALTSISVSRCDVVPIIPAVGKIPATTGFARCVNTLVSSFPHARTGGNFPTMTVDRSGNLFAVWEQAPYDGTNITGDTALMYSTSKDEGDHWTKALQLPTPGLKNNIFAWPAAGDAGKIDVAWYGTSAHCDAKCVHPAGSPANGGGPDWISGDWGLWFTQTLDGGHTWSKPFLASRHFIHRGNIQTVMGHQQNDRGLGDFFQLRVGSDGEANISFADSNNQNKAASLTHAMFVEQTGGQSVYGSTINGAQIPVNSISDKSGDATFDNAGTVGTNQPNLDILKSSMSKPDSTHYKVTMQVADLTNLAATVQSEGPDLVWQTQWLTPSKTDPTGGKNFFVYMESTNGGTPTCWAGESAETAEGGGVVITYPGTTQLSGAACTYTATKPGTITITVPTSAVQEANPIGTALYSVTASTQSLPGPASTGGTTGGIGGTPPNLIDVAPAYELRP